MMMTMMMMMLRAFFTTRRTRSLFVPRSFSSWKFLEANAFPRTLPFSTTTTPSFSKTRRTYTLSLVFCGVAFRKQWKLLEAFFNRHTFSSLVVVRVRIQHTDIYERVYQREIFTQNIHTHTHILKQQKNEFWRHAPRGRTEGNTHAQICSRMYAFSSLTRRLCGCGVLVPQ